MKFSTAIFSVILLLAIGAQPILAQSGDDLFQQALQKERAEGDLEGAISLYQKIVDNISDARDALVARALLQMGKSYEKLGADLVDEARQAYERVVKDYGDHPVIVAEAQNRLAIMLAASAPESGPKALTVKMVASRYFYGQLSPDGRYFSDVNRAKGDMAVYDRKTGKYRDLTDDGSWDAPTQFGDISVWSPDSKQIAYAWYMGSPNDNIFELRIVSIDGGEPRTLVPFSTEGTPYPLGWSNDGKYILAIKTYPYGNHKSDRIVLVDAKTGETRVVRHLPEDVHTRNMTISPNGQYIIYETYHAGHRKPRDLRIISTDGLDDRVLIEHPADDAHPFWTPDGDGVVFESDRSGRPGLWYMPLEGGRSAGDARFVFSGAMSVGYGFSKDGTYYYHANRSDINIYTAAINLEQGVVEEQATVISKSVEGVNRSPAWSPDGSKIIYTSFRGPGNSVLVVRDMQTGEEQDLSPTLSRIGAHNSYPQWSADGKAIVVKARKNGVHGLFMVDIVTSESKRLTDNWTLFKVVTPDGESIVFLRSLMDDGIVSGHEFVERNIESGKDRVIHKIERNAHRPAISPDGSQLAYFESDSSNNDQLNDIVVLSLKDGATRTIWSDSRDGRVSWQVGLDWTPDGEYLITATFDSDKKQQQLILIDVRSGERQTIGEPMKGDLQIATVDIHPDGKRITFSRGVRLSEIWAIENLVFEK